MKAINPYLIFDGNALEAFEFYKSVFGGELAVVMRFKDMGGGPPGASPQDLERIAHVSLPLNGDQILMASDTLPSVDQKLNRGNDFYVALAPDSGAESERVFKGLSAGGHVELELQPTSWAEKFGQCTDRFGVKWMVSYAGSVQMPGQP